MSPQAFQRMNRYHRCRWLLLVVHLFATMVIAAWLSGLIGTWMLMFRRWQEGKPGWIVEDWAQYPVLSFGAIDGAYAVTKPDVVNTGLTVILIVLFLLSLWMALTNPSRSSQSFKWREAIGISLPLAFLCLYPIAVPLVFIMSVLLRGYTPPAALGDFFEWLPIIFVFVFWIIWALVVGVRQQRINSWIDGLLATAGVSFFIVLFSTIIFWGGLLTTLVFSFDFVLYWSLSALVWQTFRWPTDRERIFTTICLTCGYDLRGTIPAGGTVCPECGAAIQDFQHKTSNATPRLLENAP